MSTGEIIALVCVLCLLPAWAAGSIILFALGAVRCGRLIDPYYYEGGGSGGKSAHCPVDPQGPRDTHGVQEPTDARPDGYKADWWPRFEHELGRYVDEQELSPARDGAAVPERGEEASELEPASERP